MPFIVLVRHAENDYTRRGHLAGRIEGVHLNERGKEQAKAVAAALAKLPIKGIFSSPLERALETAEALAQLTNLEVHPHDGLLEMDYGEWQGQSLKKLRRSRLWQVLQHSPAMMSFPGGESIIDAQFRVSKAIHEIANRFEKKDWVVCFSHADLIKLAVAHFLGMPLETYQRLTIGLASITLLYADEQASRVITVNFDLSLIENLSQ